MDSGEAYAAGAGDAADAFSDHCMGARIQVATSGRNLNEH